MIESKDPERALQSRQGHYVAHVQFAVLGIDTRCPRCANFDPGGPDDCEAGEPVSEYFAEIDEEVTCPSFRARPDGRGIFPMLDDPTE